MKQILIILATAGIFGLGFISKNKMRLQSKPITGKFAPVAVLELITSEGCSSCPSADKLLPELTNIDSNIIALSFHVDYWNRLGWTDPFCSREYSERQREYVNQLNLESAYTPQLVVNGENELVGSNRGKAEAAIKEALKEKSKFSLTIDHVKIAGEKLSFSVYSEGDFKKTDLLAALVQKKATMKVKAGENNGAILSHINIVRVLSKQTATDKIEFEMALPANLANDNWQLIVFAQQKNDLKITGALVYHP